MYILTFLFKISLYVSHVEVWAWFVRPSWPMGITTRLGAEMLQLATCNCLSRVASNKTPTHTVHPHSKPRTPRTVRIPATRSPASQPAELSGQWSVVVVVSYATHQASNQTGQKMINWIVSFQAFPFPPRPAPPPRRRPHPQCLDRRRVSRANTILIRYCGCGCAWEAEKRKRINLVCREGC